MPMQPCAKVTPCNARIAEEALMEAQSLHDILTEWQDGKIDYRRAMELSQIDTFGELYKAAEHSGVAIRTEPNAQELRQAELVADLIRGQVRLKAA
jgi:hypothetical protein